MTDVDKPEYRPWPGNNRKGRIAGGFFLLVIGAVLLAHELGAPLPNWLFTWPMILIVVGLFIGIKLRFRNPGWVFPTLIGLVFLADQIVTGINLKPFLLPIIIIAVGLLIIFRPNSRRWKRCAAHGPETEPLQAETNTAAPSSYAADRSDFIDATAIFGGVKKIVLSKNFKGGDITNIMGGSEINLTQADFNGRVHIDTTNIFGGTKLIVPAHWDVQSDVVAVFGGVDDKRRLNGLAPDRTKVVVLEGTCLFGGVEISSY